MSKKQVVVIAGPSGSGESTVTQKIVERFPDRVQRLVTATTRPPRAGEKNGVDYYFFTKEDFAKEQATGHILESTYIANRDTSYGTYAPDLERKIASGHVVIVNPDIVGARYYKEHYGAVTIFIVPENIDALERRIRERSPDLSQEEIAHRKENAAREMQKEQSFYDHVIVNADGKLEEAVDRAVATLKKEGYNLE
ncbi:guanylate kinase [Candidatus Kaiserbacteria bacterium]|nr:guanylate kinase [Candidatus Kaiserbacteria bacterium]